MHGKTQLIKLTGPFYRTLCEHSPAALIATDTDLNVVTWNLAATELFGRTGIEMIGRPLPLIAPQPRRQTLERVLQRTCRDGATREFEVTQPGLDGQPATLVAVVSALRDNKDQIRAVVVWIRDVTNRKHMADRLAANEKMASLGTLAAGVAHHFHNILGGVTTAVDFALTSSDPGAARRALQMTAEAIGRATTLTQSLLSFAAQDTRRVDLADLTEVVLTFVHLIERPLADRKITLELDLGTIPIVAVEANRMHQVLGNLLTNAEEAMADGGTIHLTTGCDDNWVWFDFADTGRGIASEHLPLVFEPFFTTKGLLAGGNAGNPGLGLSVVHGIIMEMGGEISAASPPPNGARFRIRFPKPDLASRLDLV